ncbi:hypothetical protein GCM10018965_023440 [Nonomuraea roseola]
MATNPFRAVPETSRTMLSGQVLQAVVSAHTVAGRSSKGPLTSKDSKSCPADGSSNDHSHG